MNFRLGEPIGQGHSFGQRYYQNKTKLRYNSFLVYCRELALGTVSLIGDRAQGDGSKHDSHYRSNLELFVNMKMYVEWYMYVLPHLSRMYFPKQKRVI